MVEEKTNQPGTGIPSPKPTPTTRKQAEEYEAMLFNNFSRKEDKDDFFYRPLSWHPKAVNGEPGKFIAQFSVQKFARNKFRTDIKDGKKIKLHMAVPSQDVDGNFDAWASFFIDCHKFCATFEAE